MTGHVEKAENCRAVEGQECTDCGGTGEQAFEEKKCRGSDAQEENT